MSEDLRLRAADKAAFHTLRRAILAGDDAIVSVRDKATGQRRVLVCAVQPHGREVELVPLAVLPWDNPYTLFEPPVGEVRDAG